MVQNLEKGREHACREWLARGWGIEKEIHALKQAQRCAIDSAEEAGSKQAVGFAAAIQQKTEALFSIKIELFGCIMLLKKREHRILLTLRYLNGLTWEEIADILEVDVRHVYRLHKEALGCVAPLIS